MQLLLEHVQKGKTFTLWAKYELLGQEEKLVVASLAHLSVCSPVPLSGTSRPPARCGRLASARRNPLFVPRFAGPYRP
jgi:hypothetical protein